jgi:hypothetical protein
MSPVQGAVLTALPAVYESARYAYADCLREYNDAYAVYKALQDQQQQQ